MKLYSIFVPVLAGLISLSPAQANIELSKAAPAQGETIEITYRADQGLKENQPNKEELVFNGQTIKLFPISTDVYHCLVAIPADLKTRHVSN